MWTWNGIIAEYEETLETMGERRPMYATQARLMLEIIPAVRRESLLESFTPFLSHLALCLRFPQSDDFLSLIATDDSNILIEFYSHGVQASVIVDQTDVVSALLDYAKQAHPS